MATNIIPVHLVNALEVKHGLKENMVESQIIQFIVEKINKEFLENIGNLQNEIEFIKYAMNIIEIVITHNKIKIDKKQLLIDVFKALFHQSMDEKAIITLLNSSQFIYDNGHVIVQKNKLYNRILKAFLKFIKRVLDENNNN
jgi:transcriptional regulator with AAA-type ATPase domain